MCKSHFLQLEPLGSLICPSLLRIVYIRLALNVSLVSQNGLLGRLCKNIRVRNKVFSTTKLQRFQQPTCGQQRKASLFTRTLNFSIRFGGERMRASRKNTNGA